MFLEEAADIFPALPDTLACIAIPGARFLDNILRDRKIQNIALARDSFTIKNVELRFTERRGYLVLDHLDFGARANHYIAFLHRCDTANDDAHGRIELERAATGGRLRIAKHDPDLLANLVNENQRRTGLRYRAGKLAQRLRHEPCLQTHVRIAHLAIEFRLRDERGHRVD